ncbi:expressed unknown protein [Seminavis robusta]|uniref:Transmembrane protein n=1 Tax=Seminavis robusta TaxID=568900 RepID=A0A9N8DS88_9STRA|nr:expressed unknown protein [Seminavis robusta]|eukprot:Sro215_g089050.1 n/a (286) ;mRNA; r:45455-46411
MGNFGIRSCCSFPHGMTSVYALILGLSASLLALSSSWGCYFVQVDFVLKHNSSRKMDGLGGMTMGLLYYEDNGTCTSYSAEQIEDFDGFFRAARGFALMANIVLGVCALILMMMSCTAMQSSVVTWLSGFILVGGVFLGLTMLAYFSSFMCSECQFFFGSGLAVLGTFAALVAGTVVCHIPNVELSDDEEWDDIEDISQSKQLGRPPTPRHITRGLATVVPATRTTSSDEEDEYDIPDRLTVYDTEVVLVLPDGSKQVIEPLELPSCRVPRPSCDVGCSIFPETQ